MRNYMTWVVGAIVLIAAIVGVVIATNNNDNKTSTTAPTSNQSSTNGSSSDSSTSQSPASVDKVSIVDMSFSPAHVKVKKGTMVTWTNNDSTNHTVSGDSSGEPSSENLENGQTYSFTFNQIGTFGYHCNIHQDMHGTVTVTD